MDPTQDRLFELGQTDNSVFINVTSVLSSASDWLCGPLVARSARRFSGVLGTPSHFIELLLLVEDKRFAVHLGIDPVAIARAIIFRMQGKALQGASTIGQQVYGIRRGRSARSPHTLSYKVRQSAWSLCVSTSTPKASLLGEYLDTVYWGRSYRGLDCAAAGYFNKTRRTLSVAQSFFLAERIAAPNRISVRRISNLLERVAIARCLRHGGVKTEDVVKTYEEIFHCGGQTWELLER
jgi:membrane peptidoglycan carboxypeptidase